MQTIRATYGYEFRDLPQFRTRALNERGYSAFSELNVAGGLIQTEP